MYYLISPPVNTSSFETDPVQETWLALSPTAGQLSRNKLSLMLKETDFSSAFAQRQPPAAEAQKSNRHVRGQWTCRPMAHVVPA